MKRYIEILDDSNELRQYSTDSLPLVISCSQVEKTTQIYISKINEESTNKIVCAYISEDEEYLFFQPENKDCETKIFHNNELIEKSVWLKSDDNLEISGRNITYKVSGDKIKITVEGDGLREPLI